MKRKYKFFILIFVLDSVLLSNQRNPFEFADEHLKKYLPIKVEQEHISHEQKQTWKIIETKKGSTHIIEDNEGNVRSISFDVKN